MQIIIDIDENIYAKLFDNGLKLSLHDEYMMKCAIKYGTPLPKGHGKIIDVNVAIDNIDNYALEFFSFDSVPAIIEADKEESEDTDADSN